MNVLEQLPGQRPPRVVKYTQCRTAKTLGLDPDALTHLAVTSADAYRNAAPFPHIAFDGIVDEDLLDELIAEFPAVDDTGWCEHREPRQHKQQWLDARRLPPVTASVVSTLQSASFVTFLERLTGIEGLIGDPHCHHGGLHQVPNGGFLKVHNDAPLQPKLLLFRKVNVVLYLNRTWSPEWGGDLELWDDAMTKCVKRIEPRCNRMVIFDAAGTNHGHPAPIAPPSGASRRSLALYYYVSPTHPSADVVGKSVGPRYHDRPGERTPMWRRVGQEPIWRTVARDLSPPVATRLLRRARNRVT